jgi:hypothetical protein
MSLFGPVAKFVACCRISPGAENQGPKALSDNPPLPLFPPPFPFRVPGNGGGIAFRPGDHHGITPAGRAPQPLSQVPSAAFVFVGALISTLARDRTSAVTGLRALVERRCTFPKRAVMFGPI